jgi:hypothetical protein
VSDGERVTGSARSAARFDSRAETTESEWRVDQDDPLPIPPLDHQHGIVAEVERRLSIVREVEAEVDANLKRAQALRQAVLAPAFTGTCDATKSALTESGGESYACRQRMFPNWLHL